MARPSTRRSAARGTREWALRGGLAIGALVLGYVSITQTLAFVNYKADPERAYALVPGDGRIAGELAEQLAAGEADAAQRARANRLARQALANEPLAAPALTALALNTQLAGNTNAARRLFVHSERLSRRELVTQLWFIEDAVSRNDIAGALRHYDIALRTSKSAPDLLFPILSSALADPEIAESLAGLLASQRPAWGEAFVQYLGSPGADPTVSAGVLRRLASLGYAIPAASQTGVINALVARGAFADAWRYYTSIRNGAVRDRSRDPGFAAQLQTPSAFDWTPVMNDAGVSASIDHARDGGIFDFAAPSTVGGLVLQQVQLLPAGRYRIEGTSSGIEQPGNARPYWQLSCMDGRELGRVDVPDSAQADGRFTGEFTVAGEGCTAQTLRLVVRPSTEIGGVTGQIGRVQLVPVGPR
jgi:hypothetical protein